MSSEGVKVITEASPAVGNVGFDQKLLDYQFELLSSINFYTVLYSPIVARILTGGRQPAR